MTGMRRADAPAGGLGRVEGMVQIEAALSTASDTRQAATEAAMAARNAGPGGPPSLAVVFASLQHAERAGEVVDAVHEAAAPEALIGCVGEAILGGGREVEAEPAVSVWMGWFPAKVETYHVHLMEAAEGMALVGWPEAAPDETHLLLCDPFSFPAEQVLRAVEQRWAGTVAVGGMASGAAQPGQTRLFLGREVVGHGAVGARLPRQVRVRTLVSQGCRPVGPAYTVTRSEENLINELGGRPPLERIREIYESVDSEDRAMLQAGLLLGVVIDEYKTDFDRGDFLVRGVLGADRETGALAVGDHVQVGETVRFHVRDARSADQDLRRRLQTLDGDAAGVLVFTCNGRGSRMFSEPDHDASMVSERLGNPPLAGFFCAGELGPVGSRNFLHGFTASLAAFYDEPG